MSNKHLLYRERIKYKSHKHTELLSGGYLHLGAFPTRYHHSYVAAIKENMGEFCNSLAFRSELELCDIHQHHVDIAVKTEEGPDHFLVILHYDVYPGPNTFVD